MRRRFTFFPKTLLAAAGTGRLWQEPLPHGARYSALFSSRFHRCDVVKPTGTMKTHITDLLPMRLHFFASAILFLVCGLFTPLHGQSLPDHSFNPNNPSNPYGLTDLDPGLNLGD